VAAVRGDSGYRSLVENDQLEFQDEDGRAVLKFIKIN
jgi:hypothetical protein